MRGKGRVRTFRGEAFVDGQLVAEAEYLATIQPRDAEQKDPAAAAPGDDAASG